MSRNDRADPAKGGPPPDHRSGSLGVRLWSLLIAIGPVAAQTPVLVPKVQNGGDSPAPPVMAVPANAPTQKFTMAVGKSIIVDLPADASEVFVGKPEVANAVVRSARRLYVMAMGKGPTTIFALDKDGRQIATLEINVNGPRYRRTRGHPEDRDAGQRHPGSGRGRFHHSDPAPSPRRSMPSAPSISPPPSPVTRRLAQVAGPRRPGVGPASRSQARQWVVAGQIINSLVIRGQDQVTLKVQVVEIRRDIVKQLGVALTGSWGTSGSGNSSGFSSLQSPLPRLGSRKLHRLVGKRNWVSAASVGQRSAVMRSNPPSRHTNATVSPGCSQNQT